MFCGNCGHENQDGTAFCVACGNPLRPAGTVPAASQGQAAPPLSNTYGGYPAPMQPKKNKTGLILGLVLGGVVLIGLIALLAVLLGGGGSGVIGVWYCDDPAAVLEFEKDGTVSGYSNESDEVFEYEFDKKDNTGVIIEDGEEVKFVLDEDELIVEDYVTFTRAGKSFDIDKFLRAHESEESSSEVSSSEMSSSEVSETTSVTDMTLTLTFSYGERTGTYTGEMRDGLPNGYGAFSSVNDEGTDWVYEGDWVDGHYSGYGSTTFADGYYETGYYENDYLNGEGSLYLDGVLVYSGNFEDDYYHGFGTLYNYHGDVIYSGEWYYGYISETAEAHAQRIDAFKAVSSPYTASDLYTICESEADVNAQVTGTVFFVYEYSEEETYYCDFMMYEGGIEDTAHIVCVLHRMNTDETLVTVGQTVTVWGTTEYLYSYTSVDNNYLTVPLVRAWSVE